MSGKVRRGGARVSSSSTAAASSSLIPSSTKKTIQNIKDVTGNDCENEIYAMLKECSMDPNETVSKLLLLDTFHEVKRKRDKKKDNASKEASETRIKTALQSRGAHSGRPNHPPRYVPHDTGPKSSMNGKDNDAQHGKKETNISTPAVSVIDSSVECDGSKIEAKELKPPVDCASADSYQNADDNNSDSPPAVCFSTSDPVLLSSSDVRVPGTVGTIKREVGTNRVSGEPLSAPRNDNTGKVSDKKHEVAKSNESLSNRPSSNHTTRSPPVLPTQKASGSKEWKPKSSPPSVPQSSVVETTVADEKPKSQKRDDVKIPPRQHVIIPNHIHVPESERSKLSFGSFDANFAIPYVTQESESSPPLYEEANDPEEIPQQDTPSSSENTPETAEANQPPLEASAGQTATFEVNDSQPRDVSRVQNYVVPPAFDPANYYGQYYRPGADADGRISPFLPKYSGNVAPEGMNVVPVPRSSQAQPPPCFRPPGLHIPHYPPNYIPYPHYFSPFYVPHFLSNQPGANTQVPVHAHVPGYSIPSVSSGGATPTSEEASSVFIAGQQSEGFGAWVPRDSFFNLPPHGQHVAYANVYAPPQPIGAVAGASDIVGPVPNPYQQPQHQQINWPTNY